MAKIAFFELEEWEKDYLAHKLPDHELLFFLEPLGDKNITQIADADVIAVFIYSPINEAVLAKLPRLRFVTTMSTGYDHIDLVACAKRKIIVSNIPSYGENTVAEHTFALILALTRKIIESVERTRRGNFSLEGLRGADLKGKVLGVIGTGRIGKHVIRIAKGFELTVIATDPYPDKEFAAKMGFEYVDLDSLLASSDIITLHAPLTPQTKHMINLNNIGKIKRGAILINTARGGLVQTEALLKAIEQGILSAAGLDVLEEECFIKEEKQLLSRAFERECDLRTVLEEHILLAQDNVIITPHNAFNSTEALQRILDTTVENIKAFLAGAAVNVVGK